MGGLEIVKDHRTNESFETPVAPLIVAEAAKRGLICRSVVFDGQDTVVFAPPLKQKKRSATKGLTNQKCSENQSHQLEIN